MKVLMGILFALIPALLFGFVMAVVFQDYTVGLISAVGVFCVGADVLFTGK